MKLTITIEPDSAEEATEILQSLSKDPRQPDLPMQDTPVPPAPVAPVVPQAPAPATEPEETDVDIDGLPWDERIHSSNRKKTIDGRWRRKRGVSDSDYEAVKAELLDEPVHTVEHVAPSGATPPPPPPPPAEEDVTVADVFGLVNQLFEAQVPHDSIVEVLQSEAGAAHLGELNGKPPHQLAAVKKGLEELL